MSSIVNYHNLYKINFNEYKNLISNIEEKTDVIALKIKNNAESLTDKINCSEKAILTITSAIENIKIINSDAPGISAFNKILNDLNNALKKSISFRDHNNGIDPSYIQEIVHQILGISAEKISENLRNEYFDLMQSCGFIECKSSSIVYQPGHLAKQWLEEHPDVHTLNIGCGQWIENNPSSCLYTHPPTHHDRPSFKIDISASIAPDLTVDMHDQSFWEAIPNEQFEDIYDHTNALFLLDHDSTPQTLEHVYRVLMPHGTLVMDSPFKENHLQMLKKVGFIIQDDFTAIKKP